MPFSTSYAIGDVKSEAATQRDALETYRAPVFSGSYLIAEAEVFIAELPSQSCSDM